MERVPKEAGKNTDAAINHSLPQNEGQASFQFKDNRPEAVAQRNIQSLADHSFIQSKQSGSDQAHAVQKKKNTTGMPDQLKSGVENLSGIDMSDVKVHYNSSQPAQLNAHAYAQGTNIHIAPGQEKHLPHEAWHVVQQKQGRVKPTMQMKKGVAVNDDAGLEKEADVMGAKAIQMHHQEINSDQFSIHKISDSESVAQSVNMSVVQRVPIDLSAATIIKPGPPATLKDGSYYYKVFTTQAQANAIAAEWNVVERAGVLTPVYKVVQVTTNNGAGWAFRSKEVGGTFFQFSKPGHKAKVITWIGKQEGKTNLQRLRNIFDYVHKHIGDGQGFFEDNNNGDLRFIDINTGGTTPNAQDVVVAIDEKLQHL